MNDIEETEGYNEESLNMDNNYPLQVEDLEEAPSPVKQKDPWDLIKNLYCNELIPEVKEESLENQIIDHFDKFGDQDFKSSNKASCHTLHPSRLPKAKSSHYSPVKCSKESKVTKTSKPDTKFTSIKSQVSSKGLIL